MSAAAVLEELRRRGVVLTFTGDRLVASGPCDSITPEVEEVLRRNRYEILTWANERQQHPARYGPAPEPPDQSVSSGSSDDISGLVLRRFAEGGTQPAPDDLINAATQELHLSVWRAWLDAVYRGEMSLVRLRGGQMWAVPRGLTS